jgi:hypothetical protein
MDELEVLKKEWQSREQEFPKLSSKEIYPMLLSKSSSLVKWIFYISIAELILWTSLAFVAPESSKQINEAMGLKSTLTTVSIIGYVITIVFIILFYKNYRSIKVTDSIKNLMRNILRTRKTVQYFVYYNIGAAIVLLTYTNIFYYNRKDTLYDTFSKYSEDYAAIPAETFTDYFFLIQIIVGAAFVLLLVLFYYLVYGLLLRRLKRNYRELKKIEV